MPALVSIIMPVKNASSFLMACLDSILDQSYSNWELIAVNDHSSDESKTILEQYALRDDRILIFDNVGLGIIPALKHAYVHSSGSYITRMDADDIMMPYKLESMVHQLEDQSNAVAIGQVEYFIDNSELGDGYRKYQDWLNGLSVVGNNFSEIYKECVIPSPCWMMHRTDFDAIGGFESDQYPEDYDLAYRMYQAGCKVLPSHQVLHRWRDYPSRTSRTDDNYADNRFLEIKVHYFTEIDYDTSKPLILWGAGKKGKQIAQLLINKGITFRWICDNPKKIGKDIYRIILEGTNVVSGFGEGQVIGAVAGEAQIKIQESNLELGLEWYWFC